MKGSLPTDQGLELHDLEGPCHPKVFHGSVKMLLSELMAEIFTCHLALLPLEGIVSLGTDGLSSWMQGWKCVPARGSAYPQPLTGTSILH